MLTPDGVRYLASAEKRVARPFHYRWLVPRIVGNSSETRWRRTTHASLLALLPATWWYVGGWRGVAAALCITGLAGVWKFNWKHPVLVDAPAMLIALLAADCLRHGLWPLAILLAIAGGCVRETAPIFAALFGWSPLPLIGLLAPAVRHLQAEGPDVLDVEARWILDHPIKASRKYHQGFTIPTFVLPWGIVLIGFGHPTLQLVAVLAFAYGQCLIATDTVRLYMWAWPVLLASAVALVPLAWLPLFVVVSLSNPFASEGG